MTTEDEIMKGCGQWSKGKLKGLPFETQCGNTGFKDKVCLCDVCREKLKTFQEAIKLGEEKARKEFLEIVNQAEIHYNNNSDWSAISVLDFIKQELQKQEAKK